MSLVLSTRRIHSTNNAIGSVKSKTMDPPTMLEYGALHNHAAGASKSSSISCWGSSAADGTVLPGK